VPRTDPSSPPLHSSSRRAFFQGGFIPDVLLYLSYYFPNDEVPIRIALFFTTKCVSSSSSSSSTCARSR